jgi:hypothetical protein
MDNLIVVQEDLNGLLFIENGAMGYFTQEA